MDSRSRLPREFSCGSAPTCRSRIRGDEVPEQRGATMGTPDFMPPEQARGLWDEVDGTSDLWSVGAMMFALLRAGVQRAAAVNPWPPREPYGRQAHATS